MKHYNLITLALVVIFFHGCATNSKQVSAFDEAGLYHKVKATHDKYRNVTTYKSIDILDKKSAWGSHQEIRTWLENYKTGDDKSTANQIVNLRINVKYFGEGWRFYKSAASSGKTLNLAIVDRNVETCSGKFCFYVEQLVIKTNFKQLSTLFNSESIVAIGISDRYNKNIEILLSAEYLISFKKRVYNEPAGIEIADAVTETNQPRQLRLRISNVD